MLQITITWILVMHIRIMGIMIHTGVCGMRPIFQSFFRFRLGLKLGLAGWLGFGYGGWGLGYGYGYGYGEYYGYGRGIYGYHENGRAPLSGYNSSYSNRIASTEPGIGKNAINNPNAISSKSIDNNSNISKSISEKTANRNNININNSKNVNGTAKTATLANNTQKFKY